MSRRYREVWRSVNGALFQPDLGEHPPPLDEFIFDLHRTDYRSGRMRYGLWPKLRPGEVEANARWFGKAILIIGFGLFAFLLWRRDFRGEILVVMVGAMLTAMAGGLLIRAGRR